MTKPEPLRDDRHRSAQPSGSAAESAYTTKIMHGSDPAAISEAARLLRAGELVGLPTETVYGLAANAFDPAAVARIFAAKGRPQDNPLIIHIAHIAQLEELTDHNPCEAASLDGIFWPGPLTLVLPRSRRVPDIVTAGLPTVAVRLPSHPVALAVLRECNLPLAAPSANLSGRPSPTAARHCLADLRGKIPLILDGGDCAVGVESTVLSLAGPVPRLLRPGVITPSQLREVLGRLEIDPAILCEPDDDTPPVSPGMKYRHYAPKAKVILLRGPWRACRRVMAGETNNNAFALVFDEELTDCPLPALPLGPYDDAAAHARRLFAALREADERGAATVYARTPENSDDGMALAVYNRLLRASGFTVMDI